MLASGASIVVDLKHLAVMSTDYFYSQKLEINREGGNYEDGNPGPGEGATHGAGAECGPWDCSPAGYGCLSEGPGGRVVGVGWH